MKRTMDFKTRKKRKMIRMKLQKVQDAIADAATWFLAGGYNIVGLIITYAIALFVIKD